MHKGGGSASGGNSANPKPTWYPKNEDAKRFLGKPGEIKETVDKNGERRLTKIGKDGKAEKERHFSDHKRPDKHTNPHDHEIDWSNGYPNSQSPINYPNGKIPEFKSFKGVYMYTKNEHILEYPNYKNMEEFKESLVIGKEIGIRWKNIDYTIEYEQNKTFSICEAYKPETESCFKSTDELLEFKLKTGEALKDIILQAEIMWRNI